MSVITLEPAPIASTSAVTLDFDALTSPAALRQALRDLQTKESVLDDSLAAVVNDRPRVDLLLDRIDSLAPLVGLTHTDAHDLAARVDATANVAERISGKVRILDLEQSRVKESIDMVQAVQDLKTAIQSIATAIDRQDWETATRHVQRAMAIDPKIIESSFAEAIVPTGELPSPPPQAIADFRASLCARFLREFEVASSARDETNTSRYFKLFPMIGHENDGLDAYAKFVCALVSGRSKANQTAKVTSPLFFSSLLTPLLEQIANIIAQHQPVVEKYYGAGRMNRVAVRLQEECDRQGTSILSQWEEERRVSKKLMDIRTYRFPYLASLSVAAGGTPRAYNAPFRQPTKLPSELPVDDDLIDAREMDSLLSELAQISGRWELYRRFLYARLQRKDEAGQDGSDDESEPSWNRDAALLTTSNGSASATVPLPTPEQLEADLTLIESSSFRDALHEHMRRTYVPLELWYLKISLEKAHQLDEADPEARPATTSVLDDAFYLIKTILARVCSTTHAPAVVAIAKELRTIVERDIAEVLRRRLEAALGASQHVKAIAYLNDLELAAEYMTRIVDDPSLVSPAAFFVPVELDEARAALTTLKSTADSALRSAHRNGVDALFGALARPKLRQLVLDVYRDIGYALNEDAYAEAEYADAVRKRFIRQWDTLVDLARTYMADGSYLAFFGLAVNGLVRPWEGHVRGLRYTELGALRYDKDLRGVLGHLSSQTPLGTGALRDAFARLQQIGTLLNLDEREEADELVASAGWKLSANDGAAVLALRTDQ